MVTRASSRSTSYTRLSRSRRVGGQDAVADEFRDRVEPLADRLDVGQRVGEPVGQQPRAHRGDRAVEHGQERALAAALADRPRQFQAAPARLVDLQRAGGAVGDQPVDVCQRALLRLGEVVEDRPGRADRLDVVRPVVEAEAFEAGGAEMLGQGVAGRVVRRRPSRAAA